MHKLEIKCTRHRAADKYKTSTLPLLPKPEHNRYSLLTAVSMSIRSCDFFYSRKVCLVEKWPKAADGRLTHVEMTQR